MSLRIFKVSKVALNRRWITPWLTGAEVRSAEGTNTGHKNAEGIVPVLATALGRIRDAHKFKITHPCVRPICYLDNSGFSAKHAGNLDLRMELPWPRPVQRVDNQDL